jgi:EAL domain-containing protein (putative c-di-GMP-specific phosphodiesterase class I)
VQDRIEERFAGAEYQDMTPRPGVNVGIAAVTEHPFFRLERQIEKGIDDARAAGGRQREPERARQHAELKRIIRDQQIETLFQPIVDLENGRIMGYEAFARGPADSAFTMPDSLFALSRDAGMAGELDRVCQRAALRSARRLGPGHKLFLNALADSLLDPGFREGLLADLPADFPIQRGDIVLEIADRNTIADYDAFGAEVDDLRACGFRMSIDDVGKGATSLESLSQVRPDFIKVDMSLIRNIGNNLIKQELLRSLLQVARTMNAQVIVEGVETQEELDAVRRCGAKLGQGYLFQRPSRDIPVEGLGQVHPGM